MRLTDKELDEKIEIFIRTQERSQRRWGRTSDASAPIHRRVYRLSGWLDARSLRMKLGMLIASLRGSHTLSTEPPVIAEMLLLLFTHKKYKDSLAITLSEEFERRLDKGYSIKRARRFYWASVVSSLGPQIVRFAHRHQRKIVNWLGAFGVMEEVFRHIIH